MLLTLILPILVLLTTSHCETTEDDVTEIEETTEANSTIPPLLDATASKLVRYRSKAPPMSYYRYKTRTIKRPRPRVKIQKYGPPPMYNIPEPKSHYKPQAEIYTSTVSYKPSYSYDEVHYEVSSEYPAVETHVPISSYEAQAMDLDFYANSHSKKKTPTYEYRKPQKPFNPHQPHKIYGVPKEPSYPSYNSYSEDDYKPQHVSKPEVHYEVSYHEEEPPKQSYGPPPQKEEYDEFPPYGPPPKVIHQTEEISYHAPVSEYEAPVSSYHPQEQSSNNGPYPVYDKKLPNAGYTYNNHFAEPPTDVHITYSPSYDINPLPAKHGPSQNSYGPPPRNSYGPPADSYAPPVYHKQSHSDYQAPSDSYHQPSGGNFAEPPGAYLPPVHHQDELPLKKNHMPPGYDYPKSSYEVPIYDPVPFESTTPDQDYFPPNHNTGAPQHEHASESNNHIQHIPPPKPSSSSTTVDHELAQEANNKVHRFATHNFRPNDVSRHESTSKFPQETSSSDAPSSNYIDKILSTTSAYRPRRKRKRTKAPVTEKHILDAPELKQAFESGHDQSQEPVAHSSNIKENVQVSSQKNQNISPLRPLTDFSPSQSWNPMKIRARQPYPQRGQRTAENSLKELKNIEVLSIEKSHSKSYYAGTVPPPTRTLNSRADGGKMHTTTFRAEDAVQPTRSLVIDKTYFKTKDNEEDFYDGTGELPKNHKLF